MVLNLNYKKMIKTYIYKIGSLLAMLFIFNACDLERLESAQSTAEGGGTVETFMAYAIESVDPTTNVSGRVVFWKTDLEQTLVQISVDSPEFEALYDATDPFEILYPSSILSGAIGTEDMALYDLLDIEVFSEQYGADSSQEDVDDYDRDGDIEEDLPLLNFFAEFGESKFFVIDDTAFYDSLSELDAHVNIYDEDGTTIIAAGGIGANADPVDSN